jgi:hypothetical protein
MPLLTNPLGLLALLGIPAVILIHYLQRRAREFNASTLFLLERAQRETTQGRTFERLVPSVPLWMQLLAVLLLAWLLVQPRYTRDQSVQRIAVVLDPSASMGVFKERVIAETGRMLPDLRGRAASLELVLMEASPERTRLYAGNSLDEFAAALRSWEPRSGAVDPSLALRLARSVVSTTGTVLYVTDTLPTAPLPFAALSLAVGEPVENTGFTGMAFDTVDGKPVWKATLRNHGKKSATRSWKIRAGQASSQEREIMLAPGAVTTLQGGFPADADRIRLELSPDEFALDDVLPLIAPKPKQLALHNSSPEHLRNLSTRILRSIEHSTGNEDPAGADLVFAGTTPGSPDPQGNAVLFPATPETSAKLVKGGISSGDHPLMADLTWQSLIVPDGPPVTPGPGEAVLLRRAERPLVLLREQRGSRQLVFLFDPAPSNVARQASFIVLIHRFAEGIRSRKISPESANLETSQPLDTALLPNRPVLREAFDPSEKPMPWPRTDSAPDSPGFLTIRQENETLLDAAIHFADPREADFKECATLLPDISPPAAVIERNTEADPLWRLWILLLLGLLLVAWKFTKLREPSSSETAAHKVPASPEPATQPAP